MWQVHPQFSSNVESQVRRLCKRVRRGRGFDRKCTRKKSLFNLLWIFFDLCLEPSLLCCRILPAT